MRFAALVFSVSAFGCALSAYSPVHAQITCLNSHLTPSPGAGFDGDCKSVQTALKAYHSLSSPVGEKPREEKQIASPPRKKDG